MLARGAFGAGSGSVGYCFTDRSGGRSHHPYDALNLSLDVGDDAVTVAANRALVLQRLGLDDVVWLRAEHGAEVSVVGSTAVAAGQTGGEPGRSPRRADALVTDRPGVGLGALSADCSLIVMADQQAKVVGVAHCGRPGLVAGIVAAAVQALRGFGGERLVAAVGPTVCGACYQVPAAMAEEVIAVVPAARAQPGHLDVRAGVIAQLMAAGVDVQRQIGGCTREDPSLFSYRRDHRTGRMAALAWLVP